MTWPAANCLLYHETLSINTKLHWDFYKKDAQATYICTQSIQLISILLVKT